MKLSLRRMEHPGPPCRRRDVGTPVGESLHVDLFMPKGFGQMTENSMPSTGSV